MLLLLRPHVPFPQYDMNVACRQTCSHTPPIAWKGSCKSLTQFCFSVLSIQQRKGGPTRLTLPSKSTVSFARMHSRTFSPFLLWLLSLDSIEKNCFIIFNMKCFFVFVFVFLVVFLGCRPGPPVEFRFFWKLGEPEPGLHQCHQCLCWAANQAAFT